MASPFEEAGSCGDTDAGGMSRSCPDGFIDRRSGVDRREINARLRAIRGVDEEGEAPPGMRRTDLDRRRGPGRRRTDFTRAAEEGELTDEQFLFVMAIQAFKNANGKTFPSWTDVLEVVRLLGYRKTLASELDLGAVPDWREAADAPSRVRSKPGRPGDHQDDDSSSEEDDWRAAA